MPVLLVRDILIFCDVKNSQPKHMILRTITTFMALVGNRVPFHIRLFSLIIDVTMYQRSSTYIMTTKNGWGVLFAGWFSSASHFYLFMFCPSGLYSEDGPPTDIADRLGASFPHFMSIELGRRSAEQIAELDKFVKCVYGLKMTHYCTEIF